MEFFRSILQNNTGRTVTNNYVSLLLIQAANILLPLAILPYLVRTLGTEKYGVVLIAQSLCTIVYVFVEFGFSLSATRRISLARNNPRLMAGIFSAVYAVQAILICVVAILYLTIILLFEQFTREWEVFLISFGVVIGQTLFPIWFFQGIEKMRFIAIINVAAKALFTILIFIFIQQRSDYTLVPLFNSVGYLFAGVVSMVLSLRFTSFKMPSKSLMRELVVESKSLFVSNIAARLFNSANVFIVGVIAGESVAGVFGSFEKIFIASKSFFSPLFQALFPWLSKQPYKKQRVTIFRLMPILSICAILFAIVVFIFGEEVLVLLFNDPDITQQLVAFQILSLATLFAALNMSLLSLYFPAIKAYKTRMVVLLIGGAFNIFTAYILVTHYQIYGMVISVVLTELLLLTCSFIYFLRMKKDIVYV
ncbi:oligosaccharide flippase family protein [Dokdonia sp. Hel_I_53]|uniref:oligosaccharide flippase family protein n=1 Tax=Dokdonia sp. Hel_I_53 TaxID=1566287 RepID=UPI00119BA2AF|nr:oligosaccharide flippase family protein [Dokdonia sp. Hel_I_53]TVZ52663.1 PST family polysaccharide transporter [Dokdonia sp. Hel_I_53]